MQAKTVAALTAIARPATLVDEVVRSVRGEIAAGRLARGSRLPSEQALAGHLGVSRTVVREAVSQLKADGLVVARKGSGVFVSDHPEGNVLRIPRLASGSDAARHAFELRCWAEAAAAELAALRHTPADLEALKAALEGISGHAGDARAAGAADAGFHRAIAVAAKNPYLLALLDLLRRRLSETSRREWELAAARGGRADPARREHVAIYRAIRDGDTRRSRDAAVAHLAAAAQRLGIEPAWSAPRTRRRALR